MNPTDFDLMLRELLTNPAFVAVAFLFVFLAGLSIGYQAGSMQLPAVPHSDAGDTHARFDPGLHRLVDTDLSGDYKPPAFGNVRNLERPRVRAGELKYSYDGRKAIHQEHRQ